MKLKVTGWCSERMEEWDLHRGIWVPKFSRVVKNLVVDVAAKVFVGGLGNLVTGVQYHAVGTGNPGAPVAGDTQLNAEIFRKAPDSVSFVEEMTGSGSAGDTTTTLTDAALATLYPDDYFNGMRLIITGGTNSGEDRKVVDYDGTLGIFTVDGAYPFPVANDATTVYEINVPTASLTNKIEVTTTFLAGEATGTLKEHGLFGANATGTLNSGTLINLIRHADIVKTTLSQLTRAMRLKVEIA